ncbi:hypothetical protein ACV07N_14815 [Roseivirga echinicomitans]
MFTSALKTFFPDLKDEYVEADNIETLLLELDKKHQGIKGYLVDEKSQIRAHVKFYINNEPFDEQIHAELPKSAQVHIIQAISGG